jgi:hypothetical protein
VGSGDGDSPRLAPGPRRPVSAPRSFAGAELIGEFYDRCDQLLAVKQSAVVVVRTPGSRGLGGFLHTDVAPLLASNDRAVFYVGDYDHAGAQIEANAARVLGGGHGPTPLGARGPDRRPGAGPAGGLLPAPLADVEQQQQEQREAWHQVLEAGL